MAAPPQLTVSGRAGHFKHSADFERNSITVPDLGKRFLVRCFHSLRTRGFKECYGALAGSYE